MTIESKITAIGAAAILLLDTVTSFLSAHYRISIMYFCPVTLVVYFGLTYWAAKHGDLLSTLAFGAFLGLVDATIGWKICSWVSADSDHRLQTITFSRWCSTVVLVVLVGAFLAFVAYVVASRPRNRESR